MKIVFFHRHLGCGYSINKVTQTIIKDFPNKLEFFVPGRRASIHDVIRNICFIIKHRDKKAINHVTGDIHYGILGLIGCKSILTIHDTNVVDSHQCSRMKQLIFKWVWFKIPLMLSASIVCISNATKESVKRFTRRGDIRVIYNAIDETIHYYPREISLKTMYNVLLIGTAPNKNTIRMIKALKDLPVIVTIIGPLSEEQKQCIVECGVTCKQVEGVTDAEIDIFYSKADLVCFCSLSEGFGMPVIEANRSGCPVICSNIPVLREVGGGAAYYVNPLCIEDIRHGIVSLLNEPEERKRLVCLGIENAKRFDVSSIREQWINLYKEVERL